MKSHHYRVTIKWTGNKGVGTQDYRSYDRSHLISGMDKVREIPGSSDPAFQGDRSRYNPEELLVSALSSCHMLWYLHLCAINEIVVTAYEDDATGIMEEAKNGSGKFIEVTLHPRVVITDYSKLKKAEALHAEANKMCFIANSCNFAIKHQPITNVKKE